MLPISLRPNGRRAVIVGGGNVAERKAESIAGAGFPIFVVALTIGNRMRAIVSSHGGSYEQRAYEPGDLQDAAFVVAATDDADVNARIVADARAAHVLVCDAAVPKRGDFTMPATQRLGGLTITADSGGSAPAFSRRVVRELAEMLGAPYADALRTLARMREYVKDAFPEGERATILRTLAQRPIAELAAAPVTLVCATRRSELAMIQTRAIAARLAERAIATTILGVTTTGDRDRQTPIDRLGSVNVFVKELESALRDRRADYAVHSAKDLAAALPEDMRIAAFSLREDARDAFCSVRFADFEALPEGAVVGTSSPRRQAQLAALRPDLRYESLRGNVDTRLRKLEAGQYDAIVLAMAGLNRLRAGTTHVVPFAVERVVPAVGQGALAIEIRSAQEQLASTLRDAVNDAASELCVTCERAALRAMRAGCSAPLGVHAHFGAGGMIVEGAFSPAPGSLVRARIERAISTLAQADALGTELAERLKQASNATPMGVGR
jgi:hydroxymethylbilane synthase